MQLLYTISGICNKLRFPFHLSFSVRKDISSLYLSNSFDSKRWTQILPTERIVKTGPSKWTLQIKDRTEWTQQKHWRITPVAIDVFPLPPRLPTMHCQRPTTREWSEMFINQQTVDECNHRTTSIGHKNKEWITNCSVHYILDYSILSQTCTYCPILKTYCYFNAFYTSVTQCNNLCHVHK